MGLIDQSEEFDGSLATFNFAVDASISSRRRALQDYLAGPLRLIAPRGAIEGVGNITLTGNISGTRLRASTGNTNPLPTLAGGAGETPDVTAEIGHHGTGSLIFGTKIGGESEVQAQALNVVKALYLNPQGGDVYVGAHKIGGAALGRLGTTSRTTNTAGFTTIIYPNSVVVTALANRKLRVRVHTNVQSATAGCGISIGVADAGGTILNQAYVVCSTANAAEQVTCEFETTSGAGGSLTYQISAFASGGTGLVIAAATAVTYITVFDEGAV